MNIKNGKKTAYQKIVESHTVMVLPDGRLVLKIDGAWCHEITSPNAFLDMQERGIDVVFNRNEIKTMIDHVNPAGTTESAVQGRIVRKWSKKHGVEFLEVGSNGICHAIIPEKGWILPGQIGIMGDSHTCTHGSVCAFTVGVGTTELESGIITGLFICQPQKVIRVNFVGDLPTNVFAKDLILALIHKIGVKGANNAVLEFGGSVIDGLSVEARMTMTNMTVEAGATTGIVNVDMKTIRYLMPALINQYGKETRASQMIRDLSRWNSDPGVQYDRVVEIDVTNMTPLTTINYSPGEVVPVAVLVGKSVDQVVIGSCTNGRIEDLRIAASIFRQVGAKVAGNTRCIIIPATQYIYERALEEGLIKTFVEAGCFVSGPTCGPCLGMSCGVIAPGEVCVSTTNRNFEGRMGKGGMVHLVSPATAALAAIWGTIVEPLVHMCETAIEVAHHLELISKHEPIRPSTWKGGEAERPDYAALLSQAGEDRHPDFSGQAFYLPGDNINTDQIIPAKYLNEVRKEVFGAHCLENVITEPVERARFQSSRILVAGDNFGCGSSREHAAWAFQGLGIGCIIAPSFARIFENNFFAIGLLCITLPKHRVEFLLREKPERLSIFWEHGLYGTVRWGDYGADEERFVLDEFQKKLLRKGGSVIVTIELAAELQAAGKL